jgi:hypothetical protein
MTRHQRHLLRSIVHGLRPSSASFAAAAALYDPQLVIRLQAAEHERAPNSLEEGPVCARSSIGA